MAQAGVIQGRPLPRETTLDQSVARIRILTVIGVIAAWEALALVGRLGFLYTDVVPSAWTIAVAIGEELVSAGFYRDLGITFAEHIVGFVGGSTIALFLGIAMGTNVLLRKSLEPYLNAIGSTPKIIFLPILFLMFGIGIESKMAKGALSGFFPTVFSATAGILMINPVLIRVGRSFNLSRWQMVAKIYLPAMVNPVIVGLRLGLAIVIISVLIAELKFSQAGLGFQLAQYYESFRIAPMYAMIVIIFALAALANWGMTVLQNRANRHRNVDGRSSAAGSLTVT
jgi:ABC-type nitrate/sulfonate/bicarbonate transport system permease component